MLSVTGNIVITLRILMNSFFLFEATGMLFKFKFIKSITLVALGL